MASAIVQAKTFHQTFSGVFAGGLDTAIDNLWSNVNAFLATLPSQSVLDVQSHMSSVTTNGSDFYYEVIVIYKE